MTEILDARLGMLCILVRAKIETLMDFATQEYVQLDVKYDQLEELELMMFAQLAHQMLSNPSL